jgi:hypothetical protein
VKMALAHTEVIKALTSLATWFGIISLNSLTNDSCDVVKILIANFKQKIRCSGIDTPRKLAVFQTCMHDKVFVYLI